MKKLFYIFALVGFVGCSSAEKIDDVNFLITDIQKAVGETLPAGILQISENRHEYTSNYFFDQASKKEVVSTRPGRTTINGKPPRPIEEEKPRHRYKAFVVILGDQRPYSYEVTVFKETLDKSTGEYEQDGSDKRLGHRIAVAIQDYLVKKLRSKNIIDDFRPF